MSTVQHGDVFEIQGEAHIVSEVFGSRVRLLRVPWMLVYHNPGTIINSLRYRSDYKEISKADLLGHRFHGHIHLTRNNRVQAHHTNL